MSLAAAKLREPDRIVLEDITSKWSILVLAALCDGPMRFNVLRRELDGVTQKALTQCLRRLQASGFITRKVVSTAPVAVTYEVSPLGRSLEPHLQAILQWAADNRAAVQSAQEAFSLQKDW